MPSGAPHQWLVEPDNGDELSTCPMVFTSDVGTLEWREGEPEAVRAYLLKGGMLWVDDFWGDEAWGYWLAELARVLDPERYPVVEIPPDHPILTYPYLIEPWQMTNISNWKATGQTTEQDVPPVPRYRAVFDEHDGLMVLMTHNTDVFDAWEMEADAGFFDAFAGRGYGFGLNVLLHVMSH